MTFWYLSFATETANLGATIVEAASEESAFATATMRGLNPGGSVMIWEIPVGAEEIKALFNRLASPAELRALGGRKIGDLPADLKRYAETTASEVCECCNPRRLH